ncbi:LacI family DNA-binding transcriptional regulator [Tessaracoccus caeni]|uniref:LacI family DNA-binding transcriptional regulator n=1 Tax=Tessaracoccus caeni TaxID=3031239 RepID=UPI0023DAF9AE|nr:LacI family DNA-binding transcriptional regulator [Tessaracoccus caeni]MDF1489017.1 LacI family DNA-binding transcriptional regulator [Tessaracoccus caeni]
MARRATAQDVADLAGVARSSVSMVFNQRADGFLAKETQQRIREAAAQLGYTPNQVARSLRNQRSGIIGVISDVAVTGPFDGEIIAGADRAAGEHGFVIVSADSERRADDGAAAIAGLLGRNVDGLILLRVGMRETTVLDSFLSVPGALANCYPRPDSSEGALRLPVFLPDEVAGGRTAAEHLIELGHRRIAFIGGEDTAPATWQRQEGFRLAMAAATLPVREDWVTIADYKLIPGYHAALRMLDVPVADRPTAILMPNDRAASGALLAAARLGLEVPGDLSIMGYDDERRLADDMVPLLSTMALPLAEMGRCAMLAVLAAINPESAGAVRLTPGPALLPCRLVVRGSTGPAPS